MPAKKIKIEKRGFYQFHDGARYFVHDVSKGTVTYAHRLSQWSTRQEPVSEFQKKVKCRLKHLHPTAPDA